MSRAMKPAFRGEAALECGDLLATPNPCEGGSPLWFRERVVKAAPGRRTPYGTYHVLAVVILLICAPHSFAGSTDTWQVCGPFKTSGLFDPVLEEEGALTPARHPAIRGREWTTLRAKQGRVSLMQMEERDHASIFAHAVVMADDETDLWLSVRSDDGVIVWWNGRRVLAHDILRGMEFPPDRILVRTKKGENDLLLKVYNAGGDWGFAVDGLSAVGGGVGTKADEQKGEGQ